MSKKSNPSIPVYARPPVIGAAFGVLLVLSPILLGAHGFLIFFSLGGLVIVVGGVIAVAFMSFAADDVQKALDAIVKMFKAPKSAQESLQGDMASIVNWSGALEKFGARQFEQGIGRSGITDPFVKYGLNMVLSDYPPEDVRSMMETAADACYERDSVPVDILHAMASHAPAFGMVGTLVGMVAMLCNLSSDVSGIGSSLAVAFLSTLYGVISARMVYMPAAARLRQEVENRRFRYHLMTEGLAMLASKKPPMQIQDRLNSFLKPEIHNYFDCFSAYKMPPAAAKPARPAPLRAVGA
jgi:chemotaxis protein MotA